MDLFNFFPIVTVDGQAELDLLDTDVNRLGAGTAPVYYGVQQEDQQVPDLISYKVYLTEYLWWVVCLAAGVDNPFWDLRQGQQVALPGMLDLVEFQKEYSRR